MDVVVTVPRSFGIDRWIAEGDPAGRPWSGTEWDFYLSNRRPKIEPGERVYVVYNGALRGYAPLVRVEDLGNGYDGYHRYSLVRHNDAVTVTVPFMIRGFQGFRYRWWERELEVPFPDWMTPEACVGFERTSR